MLQSQETIWKTTKISDGEGEGAGNSDRDCKHLKRSKFKKQTIPNQQPQPQQ